MVISWRLGWVLEILNKRRGAVKTTDLSIGRSEMIAQTLWASQKPEITDSKTLSEKVSSQCLTSFSKLSPLCSSSWTVSKPRPVSFGPINQWFGRMMDGLMLLVSSPPSFLTAVS
jgi:hypothetical protein